MATISRFGFLRHLRADANETVLHFHKGRLRRHGAGLAYWFNPISAAMAIVPQEDCIADVHLTERSADFQELHIQATVHFRVIDAERASSRVNFGIHLGTGRWREDPLARIRDLLTQLTQDPARREIASLTVVEALQGGTDRIRALMEGALRDDAELSDMGLEIVSVKVVGVTPSAELENALGIPTREGLQESADKALFQRRALAVENARAIQESELHNEIEITTWREELIQREGDDKRTPNLVVDDTLAEDQEGPVAVGRKSLSVAAGDFDWIQDAG